VASIFKKGRDKRKKRASWYISYTDENGKSRMKKGFTDKGLTEQLAAQLEKEVWMRRNGMVDPLAEEMAKHRQSEISVHVEEFKSTLRRRKRTEKHVKLITSRLSKIIEGCRFKKLGDLNGDKVEVFLAEFCDEHDYGPKTFNHYCQAFEQFCDWLAKTSKVAINPVPGLPRRNKDLDVRKKRRALTPEEVRKLVDSAWNSDDKIQCFDGKTRAKIYLISYYTGLRRSEIASLTPESFDLESVPPTVCIAATISKHRRSDVLPIHPELTELLREWLNDIAGGERLFPKLANRRTWKMVKLDLERVGIPYKTAEGDADFHAAGRHTHITELFRSGASLTQGRALARHSDIKTTMAYTHIPLQDQAEAVANLPIPWQRSGSDSSVPSGQNKSAPDIGSPSAGDDRKAVNTGSAASSDANQQKKSPPVKDGDQWRRRGLNPRPAIFPWELLRAYPVIWGVRCGGPRPAGFVCS